VIAKCIRQKSSWIFFKEAGLPNGVINLISGDPKMISDIILEHPDFAGLHFTGSTQVFKNLWQKIGNNIHRYKNFPRIVGETGGKNFILAHPSAQVQAVSTAIIRGGFEYQGQKCSAASRIYLPESLWFTIQDQLKKDLSSITVGAPNDSKHFVNAVINESAFERITGYISRAKKNADIIEIMGGHSDKSIGYFIEPTILVTSNPHYETMTQEIFGPVVTIYVYPDHQWNNLFELINSSTEYALTGAVFASDSKAIAQATKALTHSAGNFYINDKPTGAVVGKQPFGGARASGTNDKAGSLWNLMRWVSPRTIKETFIPATDYRYPFLKS
jgi:1-pyrroline-5-carboxylate dehydrogenase